MVLGRRRRRLPLPSFANEQNIERYQRVDRALAAAVAEMYAGGTSTRKVQRVAEKMGVPRLSKDQVSAICASLDADVDELVGRPLSGLPVPYVWLDATYVKCRREGRVASTAVVTAIGCDSEGWRRVLGISVVDTEPHGSWLGFLRIEVPTEAELAAIEAAEAEDCPTDWAPQGPTANPNAEEVSRRG